MKKAEADSTTPAKGGKAAQGKAAGKVKS